MGLYDRTISETLSLPRRLEGNEVVVIHFTNMPPKAFLANQVVSIGDVRGSSSVIWYDGTTTSHFKHKDGRVISTVHNF